MAPLHVETGSVESCCHVKVDERIVANPDRVVALHVERHRGRLIVESVVFRIIVAVKADLEF